MTCLGYMPSQGLGFRNDRSTIVAQAGKLSKSKNSQTIQREKQRLKSPPLDCLARDAWLVADFCWVVMFPAKMTPTPPVQCTFQNRACVIKGVLAKYLDQNCILCMQARKWTPSGLYPHALVLTTIEATARNIYIYIVAIFISWNYRLESLPVRTHGK